MYRETELIENLKNPELRDRSFNDLLDKYQERLYWHIRKLVLTHDNANDVFQNTCIRIYKGIEKFKGNSSLHTWMYRIAYNESLRFLDKQKRIVGNPITENQKDHMEMLKDDPYFDGDELKSKFHTVLEKLTEKQRHIFQMKYFDDLSFREISEVMHVSENTLKSTYYAAVKRIETEILK